MVWLFVGAGLLTGAWALVTRQLERRENLAAFTGRSPGLIEALWWRLDSAPEILGDGTNWLAVTRASACARLRFHPEGGGETTAIPAGSPFRAVSRVAVRRSRPSRR